MVFKNAAKCLLFLTSVSFNLVAENNKNIYVKPGQIFSLELPASNRTAWLIHNTLDSDFINFIKVEKIKKGTWLEKQIGSAQSFEKWTFQAKNKTGVTPIELFEYTEVTASRKNEYEFDYGGSALCCSKQIPTKFMIHIQ